MRNKVVVAGHACLDITPIFPGGIQASEIGDILKPGKLVTMNGVDIHTGGAVSNTGLAMKLLGADVTLAAKVGDDDFGRIILDSYRKYDADKGVIVDRHGKTSYSVVIAAPGIDRVFLHDPGCNDTFSIEDIKKIDFTDTALFHFGYPPIMKRMYENEGRELVEVMKYVKHQHIATSLDMASVDENSAAGEADWLSILTNVLPYVDFFVPSIEETCWMLDRDRYRQWKQRAGNKDISLYIDADNDIKPIADECLKLGAKVVMLKCGAPGIYYRTGNRTQIQGLSEDLGSRLDGWTDREGFEKSYLPDRVLSGTGAGDTTIAAFLAAVMKGYPFDMCIHLAAAEGASCITEYDALSGLKNLGDLQNRIEAGWAKHDE